MSPSPSAPPRSEAEQIAQLTTQLAWAELKIRSLEERLRLELIRKYGPQSETLNDAQLLLLDLEPGVSAAEVEAESNREPLPPASPISAKSRTSGKHPGRQELPADLPRVERVLACTPEQCVCKSCGKDTVVIGYEQSEQLDVEPARYFVVVTKREKRACRVCAEGVSAAPLPERIIDKGLVSNRIVIDTLVSKYSDHLPLYRQSVMLERESGVSISRATMDGWVMSVGGYTAYDRTGGLKMVHAACWTHARRKVFEALQLNPDDRVARQLVQRIDGLFLIDAEARDAGMDYAARHSLRQGRCGPLLDIIRKEMKAAQVAALPSSALGKAVSYALSLWYKLTRFLEHPELELSNNLAENSMRGVALGRKNWIHVGSEQAGPKVAAILSVIESCRRLKLPVREYLASVLPGLANLSIQRVSQLTPAAWAASRL